MNTLVEREEKVKVAIEIAIKVGLLALILYITYLIAKPFIGIVVWGIIIAVALSPVINSLEKRFGNRKKSDYRVYCSRYRCIDYTNIYAFRKSY
ncbi:MAG: hypothetical protein Q9M39_06410 [Sulfurovum sp.]|nr:hypothetical protein [Sulfurovum sp.]